MTTALPPGASLAPARFGCNALTLAAAGGTAVLALHGATVVSFVPDGQRDLLWLSPMATCAGGKPLRGGIPLCGPWFGPHPAKGPTHGLMRNRPWTLVRVEPLGGGQLRADLALELPAVPDLGWWHQATALCSVTVGATLLVELTVRNTGPTPFLLSGALHSYFAVSAVQQARVAGLSDRTYIDFTGGGVRRRGTDGDVVLDREAARFYLSRDPVRLIDPGWRRSIALRGWGADATVVWNPWDQVAASMPDLGDGWAGFLCVETANIPETAVALPPSHSHHLGVELGVEPLP
jgi:glucose-6-phosphate 1-epimerase